MNLTLEKIKQDVENLTSFEDIGIESQKRPVVIRRYIFFDLAYNYTPYSLAEIGSIVDRDHATVFNGLNKLNMHLPYEPFLNQIYQNLKDEYSKGINKRSIKLKKVSYTRPVILCEITKKIKRLSEKDLKELSKIITEKFSS